MSNENDIRWIQRFEYFDKALSLLESAVELSSQRELSDLEQEGLIQRFEYTQELSWKVIKDFYTMQGETNIQGSRDAFRMAGNRGLVKQADILMQTIKSRNDVSHRYDEEKADEIYHIIIEDFLSAFQELREAFKTQIDERI